MFGAMLAGEVEPTTNQWFWQELPVYCQTCLAPHPDDDLAGDLPSIPMSLMTGCAPAECILDQRDLQLGCAHSQ